MNRIFKVVLRKSGNVSMLEGTHRFETVAPHATKAIEKATARFRKSHRWAGGVLVEEVLHRGPAV